MRPVSSDHMTTAPSSVALNHVLSKIGSDRDLAAKIQQAAAIILPTDLGPDYEGDAFAVVTMDVFDHLVNALGNETLVAVASTEDDYREVAFHSEELLLPVLFLVDPVLTELAVRALIDFVSAHFSRPGRFRLGSTVKSELHISNAEGTTVYYKYDGPAETFESIIPTVLSEVNRRNDSQDTQPPERN